MIELFSANTPNGKKISIMLEEIGYQYKIIKVDLDAVVKGSDYLIVNWDESVFKGGGTHGEITMAYWFKKPVYMVNTLPIRDVSSWIFSCTDFMCSSFDDLKTELKKKYT